MKRPVSAGRRASAVIGSLAALAGWQSIGEELRVREVAGERTVLDPPGWATLTDAQDTGAEPAWVITHLHVEEESHGGIELVVYSIAHERDESVEGLEHGRLTQGGMLSVTAVPHQPAGRQHAPLVWGALECWAGPEHRVWVRGFVHQPITAAQHLMIPLSREAVDLVAGGQLDTTHRADDSRVDLGAVPIVNAWFVVQRLINIGHDQRSGFEIDRTRFMAAIAEWAEQVLHDSSATKPSFSDESVGLHVGDDDRVLSLMRWAVASGAVRLDPVFAPSDDSLLVMFRHARRAWFHYELEPCNRLMALSCPSIRAAEQSNAPEVLQGRLTAYEAVETVRRVPVHTEATSWPVRFIWTQGVERDIEQRVEFRAIDRRWLENDVASIIIEIAYQVPEEQQARRHRLLVPAGDKAEWTFRGRYAEDAELSWKVWGVRTEDGELLRADQNTPFVVGSIVPFHHVVFITAGPEWIAAD